MAVTPHTESPRAAAREDDIPSFTPASFLKDRVALLAWGLICLICLAFFLSVMGLGPGSVAFIVLFAASCCIVAAIWRYALAHKFYRDAIAVVKSIDRPALFPELAPEPNTLEARIALGIADTLVDKGNREIENLYSEIRSERQYSELWTHEVKAPIAASKLVLENMRGDAATILKEQVERTESLVEQALYKSRTSSLAADYAIIETKLLACVREACKSNMRFLVAHGVALEFDIPEDTKVLADASWLRFIVSQLVLNSAKYGASVIRFTSSVHAEEGSGGHTVLEVRDNGCGIPAQDVPRVFDRGFTGSVGRAHGSATGMGLHLVAVMCSRMGLGVAIASEEGSGTRVILTFPHDRGHLIR